jgi:hypothetical protein
MNCNECGLPLVLCDAFALQRRATDAFILGRVNDGLRYSSDVLEVLRELDRGPIVRQEFRA